MTSLDSLVPMRKSHRLPERRGWRAWPTALVCGIGLLLSVPAYATPLERTVSGPRVELGELLPNAPEFMHAIDICDSPAVGTSRLLERSVITRQVRAAGFDLDGLDIPTSIRINRPGRRYTSADLSALLQAPVTRALPSGVTLLRIDTSASLNLEENVSPRPISLPKLPRRTGAVRVAFTVEFPVSGDVPVRVPVTATVQIASDAARPAVARGSKVSLTIQRGSARITADALTMADGEIGDELRFRVASTGKVLRGVLVSPTTALVRD